MTTIAKALEALNITEYTTSEEDYDNEQDFLNGFKKVTGTTSDGSSILSSDPIDFGVTWRAVDKKKQELIDAEPLRLLRAERDRLIAETDWWASSDLTMTQAQIDYRQALRDITTTQTPAVDANGNLTGVTWPTKP